LKGKTDNDKSAYAKYLLYKIYLNKKDYSESLNYLDSISEVNDKRFDRNNMLNDKTKIYINTDCSLAENLLLNEKKEKLLSLYISSECNITSDIIDL